MRSILALLFCACATWLCGCGADPDRPPEGPVEAQPAPAEPAELDERWTPAPDPALQREVAELEARLVQSPDDAALHHRLGQALRRLHERQRAVEQLERAVELDPATEQFRLDLALAYSSIARLDEAAEIYRGLVGSSSLRPIVLHNLGNLALRVERLDEAIDYYRQALAAKPDYLLAHYHLGLALQERGQPVEAYAALENVMRQPQSQDRRQEAARFDALHRLASLDLADGRAERAVDLLSRLLQFYPDHPNANFTYARALTLLGRHDEASAAFERHERLPRRAEGRIGFIGSEQPPGGGAGSRLEFRDATASAGIEHRNVCGATPPENKGWATESIGAGAAWIDFDGDGILDLYLVNGSTHERNAGQGEPNQLYRGDGRGGFEEVTDAAGVGDRGWGFGVAVGDVDNDMDPDLYVTNYGPNVLYLNNGDGTFSDVTERSGTGDESWGASAAFFDMEGDGDLDLYIANYLECGPGKVPRRGQTPFCAWKGIDVACGPRGLDPFQDVLYRNDGDGTFSDVTREAGLWLEAPRYALGVVTGDFDNDGDQDLYVANDSMQNSLWLNRGDGTFTDAGVTSMTAYNADGDSQSGMGTASGDYDGDGWLDLLVTNFSHDLNTLYRNVLGKYWLDESSTTGLIATHMALSWGAGFADFDRDGDLDLFIANGHIFPEVDDYDVGTSFRQRNQLFVNDGGGHFEELAADADSGLAVTRSFRGAAFGDYDNDGDVDVMLTALDEPALLLENASDVSGHWLEVGLRGTRSNRDGVGARVTVVAGDRTQIRERHGGGSFLSYNDPRLHFGLGQAARADRVEVRWPDGTVDLLQAVEADRLITVVQSSAPAD